MPRPSFLKELSDCWDTGWYEPEILSTDRCSFGNLYEESSIPREWEDDPETFRRTHQRRRGIEPDNPDLTTEEREILSHPFSRDIGSTGTQHLGEEIKRQTGSTTLDFGYCAGYAVHSVHASERHLIPQIINAYLQRGHRFYVTLQGAPHTFDAYEHFSPENAEKKMFETFLKWATDPNLKRLLQSDSHNHMMNVRSYTYPDHHKCIVDLVSADPEIRKFHLHGGDDKAKELLVCIKYNDNPPYMIQDGILPRPHQREIAARIDAAADNTNQQPNSSPAPSLPPPTPEREMTPAPAEESEPDDNCMVCLSSPPTTTVAPCGHKVCCAECSRTLAQDNLNAHRCIKCRAAITGVQYNDE